MQLDTPTLFVEIDKTEFIFSVYQIKQENNFKQLLKISVPLQGISFNRIDNFDLVFNILKNNIYNIEQKLNLTFKETILILDNFEYFTINFSGFKKLNGSQLTKDNISYILNSLKSQIDKLEEEKTILHIFNSKYNLDKKKIENLPIGLFGNFYSHELSFFLIHNNDYKNLNNIFDKFNIKIKKIIFKNFIEGVQLMNSNQNLETFFKIKISEENSEILFFENSALKFAQKFKFGSNLIIADISKVISLKKEIVKNIISKEISDGKPSDDFIKEEYFEGQNFRKIKIKLIHDIANARIQEIAEIILLKNVNIKSFLKKDRYIFLRLSEMPCLKGFKNNLEKSFSKENSYKIKFLDQYELNENSSYYFDAAKIVNFGWKKEAIPITQNKQSLITRIFKSFFG